MKQFILFLILGLATLGFQTAYAADAEMDAEQAINDSEGAKQLARDTKERIVRDRREAAGREREAARMAAKAEQKQTAAVAELARNEVVLKQLNERITAANGKISVAEKKIAQSEKALADKQKQLDSAREQLKFANEERQKRDQ
ncbi:MAG: hypothetical protein ACXVA9_09060, partial [Bdellovibrionales bacterium]